MILDNHTILAGTGSHSSRFLALSFDNGKKTTVLSQFPRGHSVYAIAVSAGMARIAAGTKAGYLRVFNIADKQPSDEQDDKELAAIFDVFHMPAITTLSFLTEDIIASGGLDGVIKLWSISQKCQLAGIEAHTGGVFAIRSLGSLVLASIGSDGILKIWDMDSLKCEYESEQFSLPGISALVSLDYESQSGLLMHPCGSGEICVYDTNNNFAKQIVKAHTGDFTALACGDGYIATAGMDDATIKIWSSGLKTIIAQNSLSSPVLSVGWVGRDSIMTISSLYEARSWRLDGNKLLPGDGITDVDLRTVYGMPSEIMFRGNLKTNLSWRNERLSLALELISHGDKKVELCDILNQLAQRGYTVESLILLADAAESQGKILLKLEAYLALAEILGDCSASVPVLYGLALLLEKLKEPQLAGVFWERILLLEPGNNDVKQHILQMGVQPITQLCPENDIRGDLMTDQAFLQEVHKYTILGNKFAWRTIFSVGKQMSFGYCLDIEKVAEVIQRQLTDENVSIYSSELTDIKIFSDGRLRNTKWLYAAKQDEQFPLFFALEIKKSGASIEFLPYGVLEFDRLLKSESLSVVEHNSRVEDIWRMLQKSAEGKKWLQMVTALSARAISSMAGKVMALRDDEY